MLSQILCTKQVRCIVLARLCGTKQDPQTQQHMKVGVSAVGATYFLKERMILAEMCRKNMEPMKDNAKMRTTKGSL